jgi:hypothetical protein
MGLFATIPGYVFILPFLFGGVAFLFVMGLLLGVISWCARRVNGR